MGEKMTPISRKNGPNQKLFKIATVFELAKIFLPSPLKI